MSETQKRLETVINKFGLDHDLVLKISILRDEEVTKEQRLKYEEWKSKNLN